MRNYLITLCFSVLACIMPAHAAFAPERMLPADNSEVASLSTITVFWSGEWLEEVAAGECGVVENESGTKVATLTCEEDFSYETPACIFTLSEKITAPGKYKVSVNGNTVLSDEEKWNEPFEINYTIVENAQESIKLISVSPENESTITALNSIETFWSEKISIVNTEVQCEVFDNDEEKVCDVAVSKGVFSSDPVTFTLNEPIKPPGKYTLIIPAGALETENGIKSEAISLTYTVVESSSTLLSPVEITPEDNSVIGNLYKFTIAWNAEFDYDFEADEVGKVTDEFGITAATINCCADWLEENTIIFTLSQPISMEGEYTITIDAGSIIAADGSKNDEINIKYTVDPSKIEANLEYWVIPSESKIVDEIFPDIEFVFKEEIELNITEFTFDSDQNETVTVNATLSKDAVTLDCRTITLPRIWTVTIPEGAFKSIETGNINPEKTYQWEFKPNTSGIHAIGDHADRLTISRGQVAIHGYDEASITDMLGKKIARYQGDATISLTPGIYLIQCIEASKMTTYKIYIK